MDVGNLEVQNSTFEIRHSRYPFDIRHSQQAMADLCRRRLLQLDITIIEADLQLTFEAAALKATRKLSFPDAHAAALSLHLNATLLTGDKEFNSLKDIKEFKIKFLS